MRTNETKSSARRRWLGTLATLVLLVAALAPAPASADACDFRQARWQSATPSFPQGSNTVTAIATYRFDPNQVFAANDRSIMRTADAGCSWRTATTLDALGFAPPARITRVVIAPDDPTRVYALIDETTPAPRPHVIRSLDGGADWAQVDTGLEGAVGAPVDLAVAGDDGPLYLLVGPGTVGGDAAPVASPPALYRNADGTWQIRSTFGDPLAVTPLVQPDQTAVRGVVVDPFVADTVWVYGDQGLSRADDGGLTFLERLDRPIAALDVARSFSEGHRVIGLETDAAHAHISFDGASFRTADLPASSRSLAPGRSIAELAIASNSGQVYGLTQFGGIVKNLGAPRPVVALASAQASIGASVALVLYARTASTIERYVFPGTLFGEDPDVPPAGELVINPPKGGRFDRPTLVPESDRILLTPGERRRIPVEVVLPGTRLVDVFFLVDTSSSMGEEITGLTTALETIVNRLTAKGVDAHFGLGQFRGFDIDPAYDLVLDISPPGTPIAHALGGLGAFGGVEQESTLAALQQIATGAGETGGQRGIDPGQNAHFRKGSLRVVVAATDETFYTGEPNPSFEEAAASLRSVQALQVGLAFQEVPPPPPSIREPLRPPDDPVEGLREMASLTNAVAPIQGVDCDGDSAPDLSPGSALVCIIDPSRSEEASVMAPAIVGLLLGLEDKRDVTLEVQGPPDTVSKIDPPVIRDVDFKQFANLKFGVTVTCPEGAIGRELPISMRAVAEGAELASGATTIVCGQQVVPLIPIIIPPLIIQPPVQAQPVSQGQPNPQPQPNAQAAVAAQRQQQPQVVYGYINPARKPQVAPENVGIRDEEQFAMSRYLEPRERGVPAAATLMTGAAMAAAFAVLSRRRIRAATIRVHATTRGRNRR